jgi:hypothetical protein
MELKWCKNAWNDNSTHHSNEINIRPKQNKHPSCGLKESRQLKRKAKSLWVPIQNFQAHTCDPFRPSDLESGHPKSGNYSSQNHEYFTQVLYICLIVQAFKCETHIVTLTWRHGIWKVGFALFCLVLRHTNTI